MRPLISHWHFPSINVLASITGRMELPSYGNNGFERYWGLHFGDIKIEIYFMHLGGENE